MKRLLVIGITLLASAAVADEGMWTFNNFPSKKVKERYGFEPDQKWLDHVQLASARLAGGCSASFVSDSGLVMTNHHCARGCIEQLSTAKRDLIKNGFYAATQKEELKCPAVEVNQLISITDVTDRVQGATKGLEGEKFQAAQRAELAQLEKACSAEGPDIRCDVVSLYQGGQYALHKYVRYQDVRLVWAPEHQAAFFGGDPDNFEFPRYVLDATFYRVYRDDKPAATPHHFKWSAAGAKDGELVFVSGNPGRTSRLDTIAKLDYARDVSLPERLMYLAELRGMLNEFGKRGAEQARISSNIKFSVENSLKALRGRREALVDRKFFAQKVAEEKQLRDKVNADAALKGPYGAAWDNIAQAAAKMRDVRHEVSMLESSAGTGSDLFWIARTLLRASDELPKPNEQRLREFSEARLAPLKQRLFSTAPVYPELETALLSFYLVKLRELLGVDHPVVKQVLGKESPEALARRVVAGSKLRDPKVRQRLFEGGEKAVDAAKDPMIELVRALDPAARQVRKLYEDEIESVFKKNEELIAKARFAIFGTSIYPDATFSARLSYGGVRGYTENGQPVAPITVIGGKWDRATGQEPFAIPPSWQKARSRVDMNTPYNFVSDNDIIGGNSGSPTINRNGEIVGLIFDGNIHSLGGEYGFDPSLNRAISVHSASIVEALDKIYGGKRILEELKVKPAPRTAN
jgi:hypothetical protein